jgi:hypothetical protein
VDAPWTGLLYLCGRDPRPRSHLARPHMHLTARLRNIKIAPVRVTAPASEQRGIRAQNCGGDAQIVLVRFGSRVCAQWDSTARQKHQKSRQPVRRASPLKRGGSMTQKASAKTCVAFILSGWPGPFTNRGRARPPFMARSSSSCSLADGHEEEDRMSPGGDHGDSL